MGVFRALLMMCVASAVISSTTGKPGTVYLCDVHIFGGNSGSPVVVTTDWLGIGGYQLLGVVSGYYYED